MDIREAKKLYQKSCPYCDDGKNDCECFDIARAIAFMEGYEQGVGASAEKLTPYTTDSDTMYILRQEILKLLSEVKK